MRELKRVLEVGTDELGNWITVDGPGTSHWLQYGTGAYSGATIRAYRFADKDGKELPFSDKVRDNVPILDMTDASRFVPLFTGQVLPKGSPGLPRGGWLADAPEKYEEYSKLSNEQKQEIMKTWRVYYSHPEGTPPLRTDDVVIFERSFHWPDPADFHPRTTQEPPRMNWELREGDVLIVPTPPGTPEEVQADEGVLQMNPSPESRKAAVWYKLAGGTARRDANWYGTLSAGTTYRYEAWVKAPSGGQFTLTFGELDRNRVASGYFNEKIAHTAPTTGQWQKVAFTFVAPEPGPEGIWGASMIYEGPDSALVDNTRLQPVYRPEDEKAEFVLHRPLFETLMASQPSTGRKGALRLWSGLNSASMASILRGREDTRLGLGAPLRLGPASSDYSLPQGLFVAEATGDSPETRMVPWLIMQVTHTEEEYAQLMEYLAAPYDPAKGDTPQSKPFAYLRTKQRGNSRPWTDDFREIIIEFGNENWHNRSMADWIGFGRAGTVHQAGKEYGLWAGYMISHLRALPFNSPKVTFTLGGNYNAGVNPDGTVSGYGQEATVAAKGLNRAHSHATYIGPRWEVGESSQTTIDDAGVQKTLLSHRAGNEAEWEKQSAAHKRLREMGFDVVMTAYEGGPSGFGLRAKTPEEDRAGEYYGKSLAMGTAMLDAWINAWRLGWTHQCYLNFTQGRWWASHTSMSQGHRPSPGWIAQTLINRYFANADLLATTVENSPTITTTTVPKGSRTPVSVVVSTLQAHASLRPGRLTVAAINLSLDQAADFNLVIPWKTAGKITEHSFLGDPRDTNLEELKVSETSREIPAANLQNSTLKASLPPGRAALFVFEP
jgi:hypothetical protein